MSTSLSFDFDLTPFNTFRVQASAAAFGKFRQAAELAELVEAATLLHFTDRPMILGGGSNLLFTRNFNGLVARNEIAGIELLKEDANHYYVAAGAGENWHSFVLHCITKGWAGVENLSLIPGNVGASPIQNIGAYGVELKDVFYKLEAWHLWDKAMATFDAADCDFGYRHSVFKTKYKGQFAICKVHFRLKKKPDFETSYGAIAQELEKMGVQELSIEAISNAVIRIRQSKLPDPAVIGNAGSFFKNPVIATAQYLSLKSEFPSIPGYPSSATETKVPAGWLIEQCGWKGYREADAGVHALQALVLVNYKNASGAELLALSEKIMLSVQQRFGILLEREVNII